MDDPDNDDVHIIPLPKRRFSVQMQTEMEDFEESYRGYQDRERRRRSVLIGRSAITEDEAKANYCNMAVVAGLLALSFLAVWGLRLMYIRP